ncbi:hypothetical protein MXB_3577 [Myxobolus squamalis]|nr:hypothetical protein MXB_3577 [Myxobolus squamalis]
MPHISRKEAKSKAEIVEKIKKLANEKDHDREKSKVGKHISDKKEEIQPRRRQSRWSTEYDRVLIPGLPVALAGVELTKEQQDLYIIQLKIEEISLKLRTGNLGIPVKPEDRSPSPEPVYNTQGVRLNTREIRVRQKLEEERHDLVSVMTDKNPDYRPPPDYKYSI